jgi:hypothetical protein
VVFAVKIENTAAARPQVGLYEADIVVVEEVEASLTRMIGIFHTRFPERVGPVRSARNTDAELLPMFGRPGLLFSGANSKVKRNLRRTSIALRERSDRDSRRIAPHNVMVDLPKMVRHTDAGRAQSIGWTFAATDPRWSAATRVADPSVKVGGDTTSFAWSGGRYAVSWNGRADVDGDSGHRVRTDNVVVLSVRNRHDDDSTSDISIVSATVGSGKVTIYRDGKRLTGTWSRGSVAGPMRFRDRSGRDIPLTPGQTWLLLQG